MGDVREHLGRIGDAVRDRFEAQKRVLSFDQYLDLVVEHPARHLRDASRYIRDCFDHFGTYQVERPWGTTCPSREPPETSTTEAITSSARRASSGDSTGPFPTSFGRGAPTA